MSWFRLHRRPNNVRPWCQVEHLTAKERYYYERSLERYHKTADGKKVLEAGRSALLVGEIGRYEGFRIMKS